MLVSRELTTYDANYMLYWEGKKLTYSNNNNKEIQYIPRIKHIWCVAAVVKTLSYNLSDGFNHEDCGHCIVQML